MNAPAITVIVTTLRMAAADRRAASAAEYALMAGILAIGLAPAFSGLLSRLLTAFNALNF
jgi:Flp pilus assembly pilin Flp